MSANAFLRIRIDHDVKERASAALASMGLSVSDAVRMLLVRVAAEQAMPFEVRVPRMPNAATIAAMEELERGPRSSFATVEDFMADLNADD